jgi:hypothetical protein
VKMFTRQNAYMVTDWSQNGHRMATDGHRLVTDWSQPIKEVTKWSHSK